MTCMGAKDWIPLHGIVFCILLLPSATMSTMNSMEPIIVSFYQDGVGVIPLPPASNVVIHSTSSNLNDYSNASRQRMSFQTSSYVSSSPIIITSDEELIQEAQSRGWKGNGTINNPIVIENFAIESNTSSYLLYMANTTFHVVIRSSRFSANVSTYTTGIFLHNVSNLTIENSTLSNMNIGIWCESCTNVAVISSEFRVVISISIKSENSQHLTIRNDSFVNTDVTWYSFLDENGVFVNNTVRYFGSNAAILLLGSNNITVSQNFFESGDSSAILIEYSDDISIEENNFRMMKQYGLQVMVSSSNVNVTHNSFTFNWGVLVHDSSNLVVSYNYFGKGPRFQAINATNLIVSANFIRENSGTSAMDLSQITNISIMNNYVVFGRGGMSLNSCTNVTFAGNKMGYGPTGLQSKNCHGGLVADNHFWYLEHHAIQLNDSSDFLVTRNNFLDNNHHGTSQLLDENGNNNSFLYNFYSEWLSPDNDANGLVDIAYPIDGSSNNVDQHPNTTWYPIEDHILTRPVIQSPRAGVTYGTTVMVNWLPSIDTDGHDITYIVSVSMDGGLTWREIASNLKNTSHSWSTNDITYCACTLKITARDSMNVETTEFMLDVFYIRNPRISTPTPNIDSDDASTASSMAKTTSPPPDLLSIRIPSFGYLTTLLVLVSITLTIFARREIRKELAQYQK